MCSSCCFSSSSDSGDPHLLLPRTPQAMEQGIQMEENSLRFLRRALLYASLVCVAVGVAAYTTSSSLRNTSVAQMRLVQAEGIRMTAVKVCVCVCACVRVCDSA